MRYIKLSQGKKAIVDDDDFLAVNQFKWYAHLNYKTWYARRVVWITKTKNIAISMHRFIMDAPKDKQVDHINGNGLDNRKCNLRLCSNTQNHQNQKSIYGLSKYKGVCRIDKKWCARIKVKDERIWLGVFDTQEEAASTYNNAAQIYFGEFANLNIIKENK